MRQIYIRQFSWRCCEGNLIGPEVARVGCGVSVKPEIQLWYNS